MNSTRNHQSVSSSHLLTLFLYFLYSFILPGSVAASTASEEVVVSTPVTRFQEYLRINTAHPNPDYTSAITFLKRQAHSIGGISIQTHEFVAGKLVLILTWPGSNPSLPSILLNSHLDSVPAEPDKWVYPPFSATLSPDGKIYARGAQDDKCVAIQYLEAIRNLRSRNPRFTPTRTVHVVSVPDEEIGGFDGWAKFADSDEFKEMNVGFALDEGQTNPGDEYRVFYADRQPWNLVIRAHGEPGDGSRMYDDGAMENLMKSVEVIGKFREAQFDAVKKGWAMNSEVVSVNPVYLKAGVSSGDGFAMNMQPSIAEAGFDIRLPPTSDPDLMKQRIAEEWAPSSRNMTFEFTNKGYLKDNNMAHRPVTTFVNDSNPWWSVFKQAVVSAGEKLARPEILGSASDARYIRRKGIPVLGFSPMKNTPILVHDHNEYLEESVFLNGIKVYESLIRCLSSFTGVSSSS